MFEKILKKDEERLRNAQTEEEIQKIISEIVTKYIKEYTCYNERNELCINNKPDSKKYLKAFVESDLMVLFSRYALGRCYDFQKMSLELLSLFNSKKSNENAKRVTNEIRDFIIDKNKHFEIKKDIDAVIFDDIILCYFKFLKRTNSKVDKRAGEEIREFYRNLPKDMHFFDTKFYEKIWLPNHKKSKEIFKIFPVKSMKECEEKLSKFEFDRNGLLEEPVKYDYILAEYLMFYGDKIPVKEIERYLKIMDKNTISGDFFATHTAKYFKNDQKGKEILRKNPLVVYNDILRKYCNQDTSLSCLNDPIYGEIFREMLYGNFSNLEVVTAKKCMENLAEYGEKGVEVVENIIRAKNVRMLKNKEANRRNIFDVFHWTRRINIYNSLFKNFAPEKLEDTRVYEDGLTNFDYADIALSLIVKNDIVDGLFLINLDETKEMYEKYGKDLYDSRAVREIVRQYIDKYREVKHHSDKHIRKVCLDFVRNVSRKTDFNLYTDQECSDIVQLARLRKDKYAIELEDEIKKGMKENPEYNMSILDAREQVACFLKDAMECTIDETYEERFEKFLKELSLIKINTKQGVIPQVINECMIRQALNKKSIINSKSKYRNVFERFVENYALNDAIDDGVNPEEIPAYFTRDLLEHESINGGIGVDTITLKRKRIDAILDGRLYGLEIIFHENTHLSQERRISKPRLNSFNEYMIIKEIMISSVNQKYYNRNYERIYSEIEAREKAAEKIINFVKKVLQLEKNIKFRFGMNSDEFNVLEEKFEKVVKDRTKIIDKERKRYTDADIKAYKLGYKTVHSIFDEVLKQDDIKNAVKKFPSLLCEYNEDGSKKTVSQTLEFIRKNRKILDLSVMSQILVSTRNESDKMDPKFYSILIRWIETAQTPEEFKFINEVISKVVPAQIEKFWRVYKIADFTNFDEKYDNYISIINLLQLKNDKRLTGFYQKGDNYKVIADSLIEVKEAIEDKFPGFRRKLLRERVYRLSGNKEDRDER